MKIDSPAQTPLKAIVFATVEKNSQKNQHRHRQKEVQTAGNPKKDAAQNEPGRFHRNTSSAEGEICAGGASVPQAPRWSIIPTGPPRSNPTGPTPAREAPGWGHSRRPRARASS